MSPLVLSLGVPLMLRLVLMMLRPILRRLLRPTRLSLRPTASTESDHRKNLTLASIPVPETSHQPFDPYRPVPLPSAVRSLTVCWTAQTACWSPPSPLWSGSAVSLEAPAVSRDSTVPPSRPANGMQGWRYKQHQAAFKAKPCSHGYR